MRVRRYHAYICKKNSSTHSNIHSLSQTQAYTTHIHTEGKQTRQCLHADFSAQQNLFVAIVNFFVVSNVIFSFLLVIVVGCHSVVAWFCGKQTEDTVVLITKNKRRKQKPLKRETNIQSICVNFGQFMGCVCVCVQCAFNSFYFMFCLCIWICRFRSTWSALKEKSPTHDQLEYVNWSSVCNAHAYCNWKKGSTT